MLFLILVIFILMYVWQLGVFGMLFFSMRYEVKADLWRWLVPLPFWKLSEIRAALRKSRKFYAKKEAHKRPLGYQYY